MMTKPEDFAFPVIIDDVSTKQFSEPGMTKREYFACMAMMGICGDGISGSHPSPKLTAREAVNYADALIEKLNESKPD